MFLGRSWKITKHWWIHYINLTKTQFSMNNTQIDLLTDSSYDSAFYFFYVKHIVANLIKH